jgi:aminobenzoyl-glutamate utilization protein B
MSSLPPDPRDLAVQHVDVRRAEAVHLSDQIATWAEPGLREYRSSALLSDYLRAGGFEVEQGVAGMPTAFVARGGSGGPVIGLMCEYDATPGDSQQAGAPVPAPISPDASGFFDLHNGIGAASAVAAVAILQALADARLPGTVVVFGTPGEKICVGKPFLARAGYFDGLDAVLAWHPRPYNSVEWDSGPGCYRADVFGFHGVSAYASAPWAGVSALDGLLLMNVVVQFMREHIPRTYLASVNETITSGGQHPTSLPTFAEAWYVFRSPVLEGIDHVAAMLGRAAEAASLATGATHDRRMVAATRPWVPNLALARHCWTSFQATGAPRFPDAMQELGREILRTLGRPEETAPLDETLTDPETGVTREFAGGADDVTEFCHHAPTARIYVAHGPRYSKLPNWTGATFAATPAAHATVHSAARVLAHSALGLVLDPAVLAAARSEFADRHEERIAPLVGEMERPPVDLSFPPHYPASFVPPWAR